MDWGQRTREVAGEVGISPDLFYNQINQESGFNPDAHNAGSGADGIAQIVPRWHPGVNTRDPEASLQYAARLMAANLAKTNQNWALALSFYNAGETATREGIAGTRYGWPYAETVRYVSAILDISYAEATRRLGGEDAAPSKGVMKLSEVLARGRSRIGDPYVWAGKVPPSTDCSGFIAWCYDAQVRSFTDHIYDDTERVDGKDIAPGDIVLYQYTDSSQPGVKFPHVGLYLSDTEVLDNRSGYGVGVHPQLSRGAHARYYRRLSGVIVDTLTPVAPTPPVGPDLVGIAKQVDDAITILYHLRSTLP